jgi:hypothetical protein
LVGILRALDFKRDLDCLAAPVAILTRRVGDGITGGGLHVAGDVVNVEEQSCGTGAVGLDESESFIEEPYDAAAARMLPNPRAAAAVAVLFCLKKIVQRDGASRRVRAEYFWWLLRSRSFARGKELPSSCPSRLQQSTMSSCFPAGNDNNSLTKSASQGACAGR